MLRRRVVCVRTAAALVCGLLLALAALMPRETSAGQSAVSISRPGQEDLSFWVNHNGLLQFDAEGEVGFGDFARILLRRRANGEYIRGLRDRFTFRIQNPAELQTHDIFRAEFVNGALTWRNRPQTRFIAGSSRTFSIPVLVVNRDSNDLSLEAVYQGVSMESAARNIVVPGGAAKPLFLRAVETQSGATQGKLTLRHAGGELSTD